MSNSHGFKYEFKNNKYTMPLAEYLLEIHELEDDDIIEFYSIQDNSDLPKSDPAIDFYLTKDMFFKTIYYKESGKTKIVSIPISSIKRNLISFNFQSKKILDSFSSGFALEGVKFNNILDEYIDKPKEKYFEKNYADFIKTLYKLLIN